MNAELPRPRRWLTRYQVVAGSSLTMVDAHNDEEARRIIANRLATPTTRDQDVSDRMTVREATPSDEARFAALVAEWKPAYRRQAVAQLRLTGTDQP